MAMPGLRQVGDFMAAVYAPYGGDDFLANRYDTYYGGDYDDEVRRYGKQSRNVSIIGELSFHSTDN